MPPTSGLLLGIDAQSYPEFAASLWDKLILRPQTRQCGVTDHNLGVVSSVASITSQICMTVQQIYNLVLVDIGRGINANQLASIISVMRSLCFSSSIVWCTTLATPFAIPCVVHIHVLAQEAQRSHWLPRGRLDGALKTPQTGGTFSRNIVTEA